MSCVHKTSKDLVSTDHGVDDLVAFARMHNLKMGTIRDLIAYRRKHDHLVEKRAEMKFQSKWGGEWTAMTFYNKATGDETMALVKGRIDPEQPTRQRRLVRHIG